jgi:putative NIF3 family GTP cyclohydrolase 1 type 2
LLLTTLQKYLDDKLRINDFPNDKSLNGLQVEGSRNVSKITLAVDACDLSIEKAAKNKSDMIIVHHGLFWGDREPITGIIKRRISILIKKRISLYAAHLPLDVHPEVGNNAQLAFILKLENTYSFGNYQGKEIGICGKLPRPISAGGLSNKINKMLKTHVIIHSFALPK